MKRDIEFRRGTGLFGRKEPTSRADVPEETSVDGLRIEVEPRKDEIIDQARGYEVVNALLREGGVVLLGDTHTHPLQHELFLNYLENLVLEGLPFTLAVELPHVVNYEIDQRTIPEIIKQSDNLYHRHGQELNAGYAQRLSTIMDLAKDNGISIRGIDNMDFFRDPENPGDGESNQDEGHHYQSNGLPLYLKDTNQNQWMAAQLNQIKTALPGPILAMVGALHAAAEGIPRYTQATGIKLGEDKGIFGKKMHAPGSFDYQIAIPGDSEF